MLRSFMASSADIARDCRRMKACVMFCTPLRLAREVILGFLHESLPLAHLPQLSYQSNRVTFARCFHAHLQRAHYYSYPLSSKSGCPLLSSWIISDTAIVSNYTQSLLHTYRYEAS